ncbi:MAG: hypothetical protein GY757_41780 [bacterium]|nr:hypothetical protein [bacterium]
MKTKKLILGKHTVHSFGNPLEENLQKKARGGSVQIMAGTTNIRAYCLFSEL